MLKWLAAHPAPYALGLLWWGEATVILCSLSGGYILSSLLFTNIRVSMQSWLFPIAILTYLLVFFLLHKSFTLNSVLMEGLINIHRHGGLIRIEHLLREESKLEKSNGDTKHSNIETPMINPLDCPLRISASAAPFRLRYFIVLPTVGILYLISFASTIYRIFARQIMTIEPGSLVMPAFGVASMLAVCFWLLMPAVPGYISVRKLIGFNKHKGE